MTDKPNQPSETAMAASIEIDDELDHLEGCHFQTDKNPWIGHRIDLNYAPLVKKGAIIAVVLDEVISALVAQDAEFAQCPFARESLDAFKAALALATPKGGADDAS